MSRLWLGAAASAFLTTLGLPFAVYTPNLAPAWLSALAAWVFLVPLLVSLEGASARRHFLFGYLYGFFSNLGILFWIAVALRKYGNLSSLYSGFIMILLIGYLSLLPAFSFWTWRRLKNAGPRWLVGALLYSLVLWMHTFAPFGGYPWALPGHFLYGALPLLQVADLVGVAGINLFVIAVNFILAEALSARRRGRPLPWGALFGGAACLAASFGYGLDATARHGASAESRAPIRVALLQGNIRQEQKWDRARVGAILDSYRELAREGERRGARLIIWPEAAAPMLIPAAMPNLSFLLDPAGEAQHLLGAPTWEEGHAGQLFRNSAFSLAPDGSVLGRYDKQHLVPFAEYVPLADILPMKRIVPAVAGDFRAGGDPAPFSIDGVPFGVLICYESLFPELSVNWVEKGAAFLVNITNDAWFDRTSGPFQHPTFAVFRAIETRRTILRAANTGITGWYDPAGRLHGATDLFERAIRVVDVVPREDRTFYVRHSRWVPTGSAALLLLLALGAFRRRSGP